MAKEEQSPFGLLLKILGRKIKEANPEKVKEAKSALRLRPAMTFEPPEIQEAGWRNYEAPYC